MPLVKIWVHAVWGTKCRYPYLTKDIRSQVISHIRKNAREKEIFIKSINGYDDHLHCLLRLDANIPIAKTIQLIKGESAFWINKHSITKEKFEWAREYYAASVSESHLKKITLYIENQEKHHEEFSFEEEFEKFSLSQELLKQN